VNFTDLLPLLSRLDRIEAILQDLAPLVTRRVTQAEHAKALGISRRTLANRLARARTKQAVREVVL